MLGKFITFEGGEASGKSTIISDVSLHLATLGYEVITTREPGGVLIAEQIRQVILDPKNTAMDPRTEALLYAASRIQHLTEKVIPALASGKIVLCDRYLDSSLAYQGYGRKLGFEDVLNINRFATAYMPDLTFFIDVKPNIALKRINENNRKMDRLDLEKMAFHESVYQGYQAVEKMYPQRVVNICGKQQIEAVTSQIIQKLETFLKQ